MTVLVPSLQPLLAPHQDALPWVTQRLMGLSHELTDEHVSFITLVFGMGYFLMVCSIFYALTVSLKTQSSVVTRGLARRWLASRSAQKWLWPYSVAAHARTTQLLLAQRIPLAEAVRLAAPAAGVLGTKITWQQIANTVERDGSVSQAIHDMQVIPSLYASLVRVGERHGTLEQSLAIVTQAFEQRLNRQIQQLEVWLGPCLLLVVGALMVAIVGWLFVPLYQIITSQAGAV